VKLDRIVVGVDFSEPGLAAARWAASRLAPDANIILCNVVNMPQPPAFLRALVPPIEDQVEVALLGAETRLNELGAIIGDRVEAVVRSGRPAEEICALADEREVDLIVVGEHGARRGLWNVLGSTAEHLIRMSRTPVLLARGLSDEVPARILAPVDHSEFTAPVLEWAGFLARRFDAKVMAFHSISKSYFASLRMTSSTLKVAEIEREFVEASRTWLAQAVKEAGIEDRVGATDAVIGDPSYEILAAAKRLDADMIVLGGRGAGAISHALLGSVARAILRGAALPVLVVTEPD